MNLSTLIQNLTNAFDVIDGSTKDAAAQMIAAAGRVDDADKYDGIEVEAVGVYPDHFGNPGEAICEPITTGDEWTPDCLQVFFTVYAHLKTGGTDAVADFTTRPLADECAPLIAAAIGITESAP